MYNRQNLYVGIQSEHLVLSTTIEDDSSTQDRMLQALVISLLNKIVFSAVGYEVGWI